MATAKKKTEAQTSRTAARPQAERRVEIAPAPPAPARAARELSHEDVARKAFEIWERNGRQPGRDVADWIQAENELRG